MSKEKLVNNVWPVKADIRLPILIKIFSLCMKLLWCGFCTEDILRAPIKLNRCMHRLICILAVWITLKTCLLMNWQIYLATTINPVAHQMAKTPLTILTTIGLKLVKALSLLSVSNLPPLWVTAAQATL